MKDVSSGSYHGGVRWRAQRGVGWKGVILFLIPLLVLLWGCSAGSEQAVNDPEGEAKDDSGPDGWYNMPVFRTIWGDFESLPPLIITGERALKEYYPRGQYLVMAVAACGNCHGVQPEDPDSPLAGGRVMHDRFGVLRAANITPDAETGIGLWNVGDVVRALRASIGKEGRPLSLDVHQGYRWMSDRDARAIAVYILAREPVSAFVERRRLSGFERKKWGIISQHDDVKGYVPAPVEKGIYQYGRYLSNHVAGCRRCHTPPEGGWGKAPEFSGTEGSKGLLSALGGLGELLTPEAVDTPEKREQVRKLLSEEGRDEYADRLAEKDKEQDLEEVLWNSFASLFAGDSSQIPPEAFPLIGPDIRGTSKTGINDWRTEEIIQYLNTGDTPSGKQTDSEFCPWPYFRGMNDRDKKAIARYLKRQ